MTSEVLSLIQLGSSSYHTTSVLRKQISGRFPDRQVILLPPLETLEMAFDSKRKQYHSTRLLTILEEQEAVRNSRILGVTSTDLYVPGMDFVFGEARCPGRVGVISTYRLEAGSERFERRVLKEAVHETGHMFGLRHCEDESCVMYFSQTLADTDRKRSDYCSECEDKMGWLLVE